MDASSPLKYGDLCQCYHNRQGDKSKKKQDVRAEPNGRERNILLAALEPVQRGLGTRCSGPIRVLCELSKCARSGMILYA